MNAATRAHTVPKFYLQGFVTPQSETGSDPFVWSGSLTTGEIRRRSAKNISIARGLYDGWVAGPTKSVVEWAMRDRAPALVE